MTKRKDGTVSENLMTWSTANEKEFIDGLGSFGKSSLPRDELLVNYRKSAEARIEWGRVSREEILAYIDALLDGEAMGIQISPLE